MTGISFTYFSTLLLFHTASWNQTEKFEFNFYNKEKPTIWRFHQSNNSIQKSLQIIYPEETMTSIKIFLRGCLGGIRVELSSSFSPVRTNMVEIT